MAGAGPGLGLGETGAEVTATLIVLSIAALYCLTRGIIDLRQRRYAWGAAGLLCAVALMLSPIRTHAVKVDLPPASGG